jgi:hypothetical protein
MSPRQRKGQLLIEYQLPLNLACFLHMWLDSEWNEYFLSDRLKDINVTVGEWESDGGSDVLTRKMRSYHPSKISFPGMPSHAESFKTQQLFLPCRDHPRMLRIKETNVFRDIPYADYFNVVIEWDVSWPEKKASRHIRKSKGAAVSDGEDVCMVAIWVDFHFFKSTWLQSTIESNSRAELECVYDLWYDYAHETHSWAKNRRSDPFYWTAGEKRYIDIASMLMLMQADGELADADIANARSLGDAEGDGAGEGGTGAGATPQKGPGSGKKSGKKKARLQIESNLHHPDMFERPEIVTTKDAAVTVVETVFVLLAFSFWRMHQLMNDVTEIYSIHPKDVVARIRGAFYPGRPLKEMLRKPDLWGPSVGVLCLPLVLLMSMEVTKNGCNQSSTLGNAFVISLTLWMALSAFYRLVGFVAVPEVTFVESLCVTGYGYFAWSAALALSYLMGLFPVMKGAWLSIPLVLLGLPASASQVMLFWYKLPRISTSAVFTTGTSGLSLAVRVRHALKLLAILAVFVIHFQSLLYLAQVYLQEKKQLCHINAVLRFSHGFQQRLSHLPSAATLPGSKS